MNRNEAISGLVNYALEKEMIQPEEKAWAVNGLLDILQLDAFSWEEGEKAELTELLDTLLDDAYERGVLEENSVVYRDLLDTKLMGSLLPRPAQVMAHFDTLRKESSQKATDWYYKFSQDSNYIRRDRIAKDMRWKTDTEYGELDISINLSKPEKDPKAIAAAKLAKQSGYPKCLLCRQNEGYAGRVNHPARQNHRIIPSTYPSRKRIQRQSQPQELWRLPIIRAACCAPKIWAMPAVWIIRPDRITGSYRCRSTVHPGIFSIPHMFITMNIAFALIKNTHR